MKSLLSCSPEDENRIYMYFQNVVSLVNMDDGQSKKLQFYIVSHQCSILKIRLASNTVPWRAHMNVVNESGFLESKEFILPAE